MRAPRQAPALLAASQQSTAVWGQDGQEDGLEVEHVRGPIFHLQHCKSNKAINKTPKRPVRWYPHKARGVWPLLMNPLDFLTVSGLGF